MGPVTRSGREHAPEHDLGRRRQHGQMHSGRHVARLDLHHRTDLDITGHVQRVYHLLVREPHAYRPVEPDGTVRAGAQVLQLYRTGKYAVYVLEPRLLTVHQDGIRVDRHLARRHVLRPVAHGLDPLYGHLLEGDLVEEELRIVRDERLDAHAVAEYRSSVFVKVRHRYGVDVASVMPEVFGREAYAHRAPPHRRQFQMPEARRADLCRDGGVGYSHKTARDCG